MSNYSRLNEQLMEAVFTASKTIRWWMRESSGLSVPQFRVLSFVKRNSSCSLAELASYLGISPPSTSRLVDSLLIKGLISRDENKDDRRRVQLKLTSKGEKVLDSARDKVLEKLKVKVNKLSEDDMVKLSRSIEIMMSLVKEDDRD